MDENDELSLLLETQFKGLEEGREYAKMLRDVAAAERATANAARGASAAQAQLQQVMSQVQAATGGAGGAGGAGASPVQIILPARQPAQPRQPAAPKMTPEETALWTTRMNLPGGAAPLLGRTLEAMVGKEASRKVVSALVPVAGAAGRLAVALGIARQTLETFYEATKQSAEMVNRVTSAQATSGGTSAQVAALSLLGGNASAARAFQERITSDPQAMQAAGMVGVRSQRGLYGNLNWTQQYLTAIKNTSKIADESLRRRLALMQGIEQEVARYSLLSEATRRRLDQSASVSGRINDPEAQRRAAEFDAANQQFRMAQDNAKNALGQLFMEDVTGFLNEVADGANRLASWLHGLRGGRRKYKTFLGALTGGLIGDSGEEGGQGKMSPLAANTQALMANTEVMGRLNSTIGGGQMTRDAMPGALQGQQLHAALVSRSLRLGALG